MRTLGELPGQAASKQSLRPHSAGMVARVGEKVKWRMLCRLSIPGVVANFLSLAAVLWL